MLATFPTIMICNTPNIRSTVPALFWAHFPCVGKDWAEVLWVVLWDVSSTALYPLGSDCCVVRSLWIRFIYVHPINALLPAHDETDVPSLY